MNSWKEGKSELKYLGNLEPDINATSKARGQPKSYAKEPKRHPTPLFPVVGSHVLNPWDLSITFKTTEGWSFFISLTFSSLLLSIQPLTSWYSLVPSFRST